MQSWYCQLCMPFPAGTMSKSTFIAALVCGIYAVNPFKCTITNQQHRVNLAVELVPYQYSTRRDQVYIVVPVHINGALRRMLFDTGSEQSFLPAGRVINSASDVAEEFDFVHRIHAKVALGDMTFDHSFGSWIRGSAVSKPWDGVLGNDILARFKASRGTLLCLDILHRKLVISFAPGSGRYRPRRGAIEARLIRDHVNGFYTVRAKVNAGPLRSFVVDTATPFGVSIRAADLIKATGALRAGAGDIPVKLRLGGKRIDSEACTLGARSEIFGCIGTPVLAKFYVVMDFRNNTLYLEPHR
jgi:hypothetical protein